LGVSLYTNYTLQRVSETGALVTYSVMEGVVILSPKLSWNFS